MTKSQGTRFKRGTYSHCSVPGCDREYHCKGFCNKHWHKYHEYGDPLAARGPDKGVVDEFIRSTALPYTGSDCLIWPFNTDGHGYGTLNRKGNKQLKAHRVICELVHGSPPTATHQAAHSCGKGHLRCVNPHHLRWATRVENAADKILHGTNRRAA